MANDGMTNDVIQKGRQVLYDQKWLKFLKRTWVFKYIPFIDFVFASGSIAIGNVSENSDFDVLISARGGRIFTARFFAAVFFGFFGWRRSKLDHSESAKDKICLNHFITPATYKLTLEQNEFWKLYYRSLVPIYGNKNDIKIFMDINRDWIGEDMRYREDLRHKHFAPSIFKRFLEFILAGSFGNWFERGVKTFQVKRIEHGLKTSSTVPTSSTRLSYGEGQRVAEYTLPPLILYTDIELQFHPNTAKLKVFY